MAQRDTVKIDSTGFMTMIQKLQKKTGAEYKDVVRGVTRNVLTKTAQRTYGTRDKLVREGIKRMLRRPYSTRNGDKINLAQDGKVWFQGKDWDAKRWVLVSSNGKLTNARNSVTRTGKQSGIVQITSELRGRINRAVKEARDAVKRENEVRLKYVHSSKASWLYLLRLLKMKPANDRGLKKAMKAEITPNHKKALKAFEIIRRSEFNEYLLNRRGNC